MNTFDIITRFVICCGKALVCAAACVTASCSHATEVEITLVSGSVFRADIPMAAINWKEVQSDGQMTTSRIAINDIGRLWLCDTPASNQVAEISVLLSQLQSESYRDREHAEQQLSLSEIGGRFPQMLRQLTTQGDTETKYRIDRILNKLSDVESSAASQFDELKLKSGRSLQGDAGNFRFNCSVDGQTFELQRNQLQMVRSTDTIPATVVAKRSPIQTEIVLIAKDKFYLPEQTTVQLETDALGNQLNRKEDITSSFLPLGLRLGTKDPGYAGISGYGFKFPNTPTGDNSGSVFTAVNNGDRVRYKKFRGTLIIDFCFPNQPHIPAGVNEFGIHIATVNHERDFIMEAFNAAGQIIATVEAGERDCPFLGVRSNELIARLRIQSNPFLRKLQRKIDDDYAFDSICFSRPQALANIAESISKGDARKANVCLQNGNAWVGDRIELKKDGSAIVVAEAFPTPLTFPANAIGSYTFGASTPKTIRRPNRRSWSMQLTDGSILNVDPGEEFRAQLIPGYLIVADQAVALWPTESQARLPHSTDWNDAKSIIVLPTGRLLSNEVKFSDNGYNWQTTDRRIQDLAPNANELAREEDPMPELNQVVYRETDISESPTLWLQQPQTVDPHAGAIVLRDGQRLMFGKGQLFQLVKLSKDSVKLQLNDRTIEIDNDRVLSLKLETKP